MVDAACVARGAARRTRRRGQKAVTEIRPLAICLGKGGMGHLALSVAETDAKRRAKMGTRVRKSEGRRKTVSSPSHAYQRET